MADVGVNTEQTTGTRRWTLRRVGVYAGRIVVAGALVAFVLWAMTGIARMTGHAQRQPSARQLAKNAELPSPVGWSAPLQLPGGAWSIAGLPWKLAVQRLPRASADAELLKPPPAAPVTRRSSAEELEVLTLVKALGAEKRSEEGYHAYVLPIGDARAVVFASATSAGERVVFARVVYGAPDGPSFLLEIAPTPDEPALQPSGGSELLELPRGARRLATRADEQGRAVAVLATTDADPAGLRKFWEQRGYRTETVVEPKHAMQGVTCTKDQQTVHVWLWPRAGGTEQTLVLQVRLSSDEKKVLSPFSR